MNDVLMPPPPPPPVSPSIKPPPLPPVAMLPPDVSSYIRETHSGTDDVVASLTLKYIEAQPNIPGAPPINLLTKEFAPLVYSVSQFELERDHDWNGFAARIGRCVQEDDDRINPYVPNGSSRAEGKENPWSSDIGRYLSPDAQAQLKQLCRVSAPPNSMPFADRVACLPVQDVEYLGEIVNAMISMSNTFFWTLGHDEGVKAEFRYGPMLCLLGGLGTAPLRCFCNHFSNHPDMQDWANASDEDLAVDLLEAHACSGYPLGLFRADWSDFRKIVETSAFTEGAGFVAPRAIKAMIVLHILKHTRLRPDPDGYRELVCLYRGRQLIIQMPAGQMAQPFNSAGNRETTRLMAQVLRLPYGGRTETWLTSMISTIFKDLVPNMILETRLPTSVPELISAPVVEMLQDPSHEKPWVNPGFMIKNVAKIDLKTGNVDLAHRVEGTNTISLSWPLVGDKNSLERVNQWRNSVPENVKPARASTILRKYIRNLNDLGEGAGLDALLDATLTADFARYDLAGSTIGGTLGNEFPLIFTLPTGHTMLETTNQGKTIVCRVLAGAMAPGILPVKMNTSTSAPVQRALGGELRRHGTILLDEFLLPQSPEHFLEAGGMQALATGGTVLVGEAGGNAEPQGLKHPMVINAKSVLAPADIINRMIGIYLDVLTDKTRATDEELANLLNGKVALEMRLAHLLWMQENGIVSRLRRVESLESGNWRFNGHLTIATYFESKKSVEAYLDVSRDKARRQLQDAERSGLIDQIGGAPRFDPAWYFTNASEATIQNLYALAGGPKEKTMRLTDAWRHIIENNGGRTYDRALSSAKIREPQANQAFRVAFERGSLTRPGWTLRMDEGEHGVAFVSLIKDEAAK